MKNKLRHLMTWLCCCSLLSAAVLGLLTPRVASASSVWITLKQISQNSDDGFYGDWGFYPDLVWNESGNPGQPYNSWYRFTWINLSKGSTILEAHLEIMETRWTSGTKLRIYADKAAAPVAPGNTEDAKAKVRTTAYVDWTSGYSDGLYHNSPDFAPVIQELVNVNDYSYGAIQILVDDNGSSTGEEMVGRTLEYGAPPRLFIKVQSPARGNTTGTVASTPQPTGGANEYALSLKIFSTTVPGLSYEQEVWCAATTTDFPDLLTVGAELSGNLDHSLGWWVLKKATEPVPVPPSEGKIVFSSLRDGANQQLYMINPDGSSIVRLTNNTANDSWPTWSPDSRKISFISDRDGNNEIYVMNADGTGVTRLTENAGNDSNPIWSRDSKTLVFVSDRDGNFEIYRIDADGSNEARLTNNPARDLSPTWSPDGSKISFASNRSGSGQVYVMDSNGNNPVMVWGVSAPAWWDGGSPAWSPTGIRIAFLGPGEPNPLYLVNPDGTNLTVALTRTHGFGPWSPDGGKIIYMSGQPSFLHVAIFDGSATGADILGSFTSGVTWSPDGKWLVYSRGGPYLPGLEITNVETGDRIQLTAYLDGTINYVDSHPSWGIPATTPIAGNITGTVASTPQPTGGANEYALNLTITSTTVPGLSAGQQVWLAATTTDFPNLLTVGATVSGNLDNSLGWWVLKKSV